MSRLGLLILGLVCLVGGLFARQSPVASKRVTLQETGIPLAKALDEIRRQTGIAVVDAHGDGETTVDLKLNNATFWQAIDTIAQKTGARASVGDKDGTVRLVRPLAGQRQPPTTYDGEFRIRVLRVSASRELDSDNSSCTVTIELTWTPTLRPLFVDSIVQDLRVLDARNRPVAISSEGSSLAAVDGRFRFSLDVALPGFPRSDKVIGLLQGRVPAIVPSKFLSFDFLADLGTLKDAVVGGAQRRLVQEDVVCRIDRVVLGKDHWSVQVGLEYPPGGKALESFQASSLVVHNELVLTSKDGKRQLPSSSYVIDEISSRRAKVTYHFTDRPGAQRGAVQQWTPRYTAPARIIEVPVKFAFRNIPLP